MGRTRMTFANREAWLEARKQGIGASDVGTILGVNPYETPLQLWRKKMGIDAPTAENNAMLMGHLLEDAVAQRWALETGKSIIANSKDDFMFVDADKSYLRVSPDRTYWLDNTSKNDDNKGILECKTTQRDIDADTIPQSWFCQVQMNLGVANYQHGSLAWLKMGRDFGYRDIEFDPEFFAWMVEEVDKFWVDNIMGKKAPDPINVTDILVTYPSHVSDKSKEADEYLVSLCGQLKEIKSQIKDLEQSQKDLEDAIKFNMEDAEKLMYKGSVLATWKSPKPSAKFNLQRFKEEEKALYNSYLQECEGARRFLIK